MRLSIVSLMLVAGGAVHAGEAFQLTSPDIPPGKAMAKSQEYNGFGCEGPNVSPALTWRGAPQGAKSYGVTMYDPDAPTGSGWWHWIMFDIPATATGLPRGAGDPAGAAAPAGSVQHRNDYGATGYGGACPPAGASAHRYHIKLFALDVEHLNVTPESSAALVGYMLNHHALGTAEIVTTYRR